MNVPATIKGIIFDLDGVIVSTDECHYFAWKQIADEENILFDREINHRLRGVSRMESLDIILEKASRDYNDDEKSRLAEQKNGYYRKQIEKLTPNDILPGILAMLDYHKSVGLKLAIGSSSKNTPLILKKIGLASYFDVVVDGNHISQSKPDPEVFLKAADQLALSPKECLVYEDADAGVMAAQRGGFPVIKI